MYELPTPIPEWTVLSAMSRISVHQSALWPPFLRVAQKSLSTRCGVNSWTNPEGFKLATYSEGRVFLRMWYILLFSPLLSSLSNGISDKICLFLPRDFTHFKRTSSSHPSRECSWIPLLVFRQMLSFQLLLTFQDLFLQRIYCFTIPWIFR